MLSGTNEPPARTENDDKPGDLERRKQDVADRDPRHRRLGGARSSRFSSRQTGADERLAPCRTRPPARTSARDRPGLGRLTVYLIAVSVSMTPPAPPFSVAIC